MQDHLIRLIPEQLLPYIKLVGLHYPENRSYKEMQKEMITNENYGGWFKVKIPDFAFIAFHINMFKDICFWIFNPLMTFDAIDDNECWSDNSIHKNVKDYRLALALAKQVLDTYVKFEKALDTASGDGDPNPKAEEREELRATDIPLDEIAAFFREKRKGNSIVDFDETLNELIELKNSQINNENEPEYLPVVDESMEAIYNDEYLDSQIDRRLKFHKLIDIPTAKVIEPVPYIDKNLDSKIDRRLFFHNLL